MKALITGYDDGNATCVFCEKTDVQAVQIEFERSLLRGTLCWPCLKKHIRLIAKQEANGPTAQRTSTTS